MRLRAPPRVACLSLLLPLLLFLSVLVPPAACASYDLHDGISLHIESAYQETVSLSFNVSDSAYELRLTLTVFTGQPDLFVGLTPNPNISNYLWRSFDAGHTAIVIPYSDARACSAPCTYFLSCIDYWNPASFAILATQSVNSSIVAISPDSGVPVTGVLVPSSGGIAWYSFHSAPFPPAGLHSLRLILNPIVGDAEMVVGTDMAWLLSLLPSVRSGNITGRIYSSGDRTAWLTDGFGLDGQVLGIHTDDPGFCTADCRWFALVWPRYNITVEYVLQLSYVYLQADDNISPTRHRLVNHVPLTRALYAGQQESYVITSYGGGTIPRSRVLELVISHTKIIGMTRMLVSQGRCSNSSADSDWVSDLWQSTVYRIGNAFSPAQANLTWCATVIADTNSSFLITGSLTLVYFPDRAPQRLLNGLPYNDVLRDQQLRYYVHYQPLPDRVTVSITRKFGDFTAYVCFGQNWTVPTPVNLNSCIPFFNADGLGAMNTAVLPAGRYLVAIQARRGYSFEVDYTITGSMMYTQQTVQAAVPLPGILRPQASTRQDWTYNATFYQYYWPFDTIPGILPSQLRNLSITCSLYSGHAALYGSAATFPDASNFTWSSDRTRMDSIVLPATSLRRGWYYFTVIAESSATFALTITTYTDVQLQPGLPSNAFITKGQLHYYWLTLPQYLSTNVSICLVPIRGFASLLIANNSAAPVYPVPSDPSTYTLRVNNPFSSMQLALIPHLDWCRNSSLLRPSSYDNGVRCRYVIAVYAEEDTRYQLTAMTPHSTQVLQAGIPQAGFIGAVYRGAGQPYERPNPRYQFYVPSSRCNVSLSLTTLLDEDEYNTTNHAPLTLFISRRADNVSDDPLFSLPRGHATVWFDAADAAFSEQDMEGFYYAEVVGSFGAVFMLGLTIEDQTWTASHSASAGAAGGRSNASALLLLDGQPQRMTVRSAPAAGDLRSALFQYDLPVSRHQDFLQFIAEVVDGSEVEIFARNDGVVPSPDRADASQWWSGSPSIVSELVIPPPPPSSPRYCDQLSGSCSYLVLVRCAAEPSCISTFQLTVSDDGPRTELVDGVPLDGLILAPGPDSWRFLTFWAVGVAQNRSLVVQVEVSGPSSANHSVQLFAAYDQFPNRSSARGQREDDRHLRLSVSPLRNGPWIVGLYNGNQTPQTVSVVGSVDSTVLLLNGRPQFYQMAAAEFQVLFRYEFDGGGRSPFLFHLAFEVGSGSVTLFVNTDGTRPSRQSFQYNTSSSTPGPFRNTVYIAPGDPLYVNRTTVYVLVFYPHLRAANPFTVVASSSPLAQLVDGENSLETGLAPGQTAYFAYSARWADRIQLFVGLVRTSATREEPLVILFSRPNGLLPTNASFLYRVDVPAGADSGSQLLHGVEGGEYRISVQNMGPEWTSFTLLVSATNVISVSDVEPVPGTCGPEPLVFASLVPSSDTDWLLYIRPTVATDFFYSSGLQVLISTRLQQPPTRNSSSWVFSPLYWNSSITIARADPKLLMCQAFGPCTLFIAVSCLGPSSTPVQYTVTTQEQLDILGLQLYDSLPPVSTQYPKHYAVFIATPPLLYIRATPCTGAVSMYLSASTRYPDSAHYLTSFTLSNSLPWLSVGPELLRNWTSYYLTVLPQNNASVVYSLDVLPYDPATDGDLLPPVLGLHLALDGSRLRWWPPRVAARWQGVQYAVSYQLFASVQSSGTGGRVLYTRCGLARAGPWIAEYRELSPAADGSITVADVPIPDPSAAHWLNLVAVFSMRTNSTGSWRERPFPLVYLPVLAPAQAEESGVSRSTLMAELLAAIFTPLFILTALIALYLRRRNRQLEQELSVELPDVEHSISGNGLRADSAVRRQRRRERAAQAGRGAHGSGDDQAAGQSSGGSSSSGSFHSLAGRGTTAGGGGEDESGSGYSASLLGNDHLGDFK